MHGSNILFDSDSHAWLQLAIGFDEQQLPSGRAGTFFRATYLNFQRSRGIGPLRNDQCQLLWGLSSWVGLVLGVCRYVCWLNSPAGSITTIGEWVRVGSDLKGYEVQFVTTMLVHQTTLLVVLVAKG